MTSVSLTLPPVSRLESFVLAERLSRSPKLSTLYCNDKHNTHVILRAFPHLASVLCDVHDFTWRQVATQFPRVEHLHIYNVEPGLPTPALLPYLRRASIGSPQQPYRGSEGCTLAALLLCMQPQIEKMELYLIFFNKNIQKLDHHGTQLIGALVDAAKCRLRQLTIFTKEWIDEDTVSEMREDGLLDLNIVDLNADPAITSDSSESSSDSVDRVSDE